MTRQEEIDKFLKIKKEFDQILFKNGDYEENLLKNGDFYQPIRFATTKYSHSLQMWMRIMFDRNYEKSNCVNIRDSLTQYRCTLSATNANGEQINCVDHEEEWNFGIEDDLLEELFSQC